MRTERIASLLEKELSLIISQELKDPRVGLITVTKVNIKPDLKNAVVYFSTMGDKKNDLNTLQHAKGFIKAVLAQRVRMKFIPEIEFRLDESFEYGQKMEKLFKQLSKDNQEK